MSSKKRNPFEGRPFEWLNLDPDDFYGSFDFEDAFRYAQGALHKGPTEHEKPIYNQCIKDAVEYFEPQGIKVATEHTRRRLTPPLKERIFGFLKERKKYYEENGLLIM